MGLSKIGSYEKPYSITGAIKSTGEKKEPKTVCKDKDNGTWKACYKESFNSMNYNNVRAPSRPMKIL